MSLAFALRAHLQWFEVCWFCLSLSLYFPKCILSNTFYLNVTFLFSANCLFQVWFGASCSSFKLKWKYSCHCDCLQIWQTGPLPYKGTYITQFISALLIYMFKFHKCNYAKFIAIYNWKLLAVLVSFLLLWMPKNCQSCAAAGFSICSS